MPSHFLHVANLLESRCCVPIKKRHVNMQFVKPGTFDAFFKPTK